MKKINLFIIPLILLSGCMSGPVSNGSKEARPYEARHRISLVKEERSMEVVLENPSGNLTSSQISAIKAFIYGYNTKGKTNIIISIPETGLNAAPARVATKEITETIEGAGIGQERMMIGTYVPASNQSAAIRIEFSTIEAHAPKCDSNWTDNLADAYNNLAWKGLGCSARRNLAAMISNPEDLQRMRPMGEGNSNRRLAGYDKYIEGQTTGAARDASETASANQ